MMNALMVKSAAIKMNPQAGCVCDKGIPEATDFVTQLQIDA
jgi:hypothetical protein